MNTIKLWAWFFALSTTCAFASPAIDKVYGLRNFVPFVINGEADPVFAEHVEAKMVEYFKTLSRFEFSEEGYQFIKAELAKTYLRDPSVSTKDKLGFWFKQPILDLQAKGVDAVLVAELHQNAGNYQIVFVLATTNNMEFVRQREVIVDDSRSLASFTEAVNTGLNGLANYIPFEATVVRRNGYRVVIDRGANEVQNGTELPVFTMEEKVDKLTGETKLSLEETGLIRLTDVGEKLSFGMITVEKKPKEITAYNKVFLTSDEVRRDPNFTMNRTKFDSKELGYVDFSLGMSLITASNIAADGSGARSSDAMFPSGSLHGEFWITTRTTATLNLDFAMGSLTSAGGASGNSLSSSINDLKLFIAYRFGPVDREAYGPFAYIRTGYMRHAFSVDTDAVTVPYTSASYSGIAVGGGAGFTLNSKMTIGFEVNSLLIASFSETPFTSGDQVQNVSGWDFSLKGIYRFDPRFDLIGRLSFHNFAAEFSGAGTRPVPISSASQSGKSLFAGAAYYF